MNPSFERVQPVSVAANMFTRSGPIRAEESPFAKSYGYVVSVHYNPVRFTSAYVNLDVELPAVTNKDLRDSVIAVAEIPDSIELVRIGDIEAPKLHRGIDLANSFVNDLIQSLVGVNIPAGVMPGIGISDTPRPSGTLINKLLEQQTRFCNSMVQEGNNFHTRQEFNRITPDHRAAARWLGVDAPFVVKAHNPLGTKQCIACAEEIKAEAKICRYCNRPQDLDALMRELGDLASNAKTRPGGDKAQGGDKSTSPGKS